MAKKARKQSAKKVAKPAETTVEIRKSSNIGKQFGLIVLGFGILLIYFYLPVNNIWFKKRIIKYYSDLPAQMALTDVRERLVARHQMNFELPRMLSEIIPDSAKLLLPPRQYVKNIFSEKVFQWYHSGLNYYYFGPRVYTNFDAADNRDWSEYDYAIIANNDRVASIPQKELLVKFARPMFQPVKNERGEMVNLLIVQLSAPEILELVKEEYVTGSGEAPDLDETEIEIDDNS